MKKAKRTKQPHFFSLQLKNLNYPPPPSQPSNTQGSVESAQQGFCEEVQTGIESKFIVFRGIIENSSDSQTTHTFGEIKGNARRVTGAISPMMSAFSSSNDINLESGDEVIVAALKDKNTGLYRVEALKNLSKDYHFSHLKHDSLYLTLLAIFGVILN